MFTFPTTFMSSAAAAGGGDFPDPSIYVAFDGTNDVVTVPHDTSIAFTTAMSFSCWVRLSANYSSYDGVFMKTTSGAWSNGYGLYFSGSSIYFFVGPYSTNSSVWFSPTDRDWHHITGSYDSSNIRVFGDGTAGTPRAYTTAINSGTADLLIGKGKNGSTSYTAPIDLRDFRLYNDVLTTDEMTYLRTGGASGTDPGTSNLVAQYWFEEGSGTTVGDSSGNGNDGTASNITEATFWQP